MKKLNIILGIVLSLFLIFSVNTNSLATNVSNEIKEERSNNYLKSLSVEGYEITPEFNKNINTYYLAVKDDVTSVNVFAESEIESASIKITGNSNLNKAENTIKVVVTSINKKTKTYNIIVNKQKDNGLNLTSLNIKGAEFLEEFDESKYYYTAKYLSNTDKTNLEIEATSNIEDAQIEILGATDLEYGENLVTIILKSGDNTTVYEVLVDITVERTIVTETKSDKPIDKIIMKVQDFFSDSNKVIALLSVIAILLLILIISVIIKIIKTKRINKNKERLRSRAK